MPFGTSNMTQTTLLPAGAASTAAPVPSSAAQAYTTAMLGGGSLRPARIPHDMAVLEVTDPMCASYVADQGNHRGVAATALALIKSALRSA